jgi:hypothetical protein
MEVSGTLMDRQTGFWDVKCTAIQVPKSSATYDRLIAIWLAGFAIFDRKGVIFSSRNLKV